MGYGLGAAAPPQAHPASWVSDFSQLRTDQIPDAGAGKIAFELRKKLRDAVARRIVADEMGSWLSGGIDSSAIAALAKPHLKSLHTFVSGVPGAPDIEYSGLISQNAGC